ncbi:MAG: PAS domain S-box protein [Methanoregula sp.]
MFRVMYVDDEPALLDLGKIFLEQSGNLQVDTVSSVEDAIVLLQKERYDGIISDYQMPGKDGLDFLKYIRSHNIDLPFILFTGRGREEIVIEALNSGADFYLQKGGEHKSQFVELEHKIRKSIERKRIQDRLRESEQRMAGIINFLPDATFAVNLDKKVIAWNKTLEMMTGIPADAVLGTCGFPVTPSGSSMRKPSLVDIVLTRNKEPEIQYPDVHRQGDRVISETYMPELYGGKGAHVWQVASPLYDTRGNMIGAIEAFRDITQRKIAEEELRYKNEELHAAYEQLTATEEELRQNYDELSKSEQELQQEKERYRSVVEDQTELICRFSPDRKLTFVNDAYCRYFGLGRAACLEEQHHVEIPEEERQALHEHILSLSQENPVASIEHRIITPSGKVRWQHWSDRAIIDATGKIIEYQSVGRDITRRKEAEDELQRKNEEVHAAYEQLTAVEEELRQNYNELSRSELELQREKEQYRSVVEDQTEFICRFTPDGQITFVNDAYCRYFQKTRQELIGRRFSPKIVSDEQEMIKNHFSRIRPDHPAGTIEHRIIMPDYEIRWQQWSDRAIFDNQGMVIEFQSVGRDITDRKRMETALQESNQKLNLLSSITRHDILNQLTALQGYHLLLKDTIPEDDRKRWLAGAIKAGETIQSQILFTQQYQDIGLQKPRWQNLFACPGSVAKEHGFSLVSVDSGLSEIEVFADPLLKTVFYNLFENAVMHGGNTRHIHVTGQSAGNGFLIIVTDDGNGIREPYKEKIFKKGFGNHTGLGLFLVREVLSITGLTITESGIPGEGARFEILVPRDMFRKISGTCSIR